MSGHGGAPRRIIPALPDRDPLLGDIRWDPWERALSLTICLSDGTQAQLDCDICSFSGPLRTAKGMTLYAPKPSWRRVARSTETRSGRSTWVKQQGKAYWAYTHWAQRCPECDEMEVWRSVEAGDEGKWTLIHRFSQATGGGRKPPPQEEVLF